jgi:hypothetical protein
MTRKRTYGAKAAARNSVRRSRRRAAMEKASVKAASAGEVPSLAYTTDELKVIHEYLSGIAWLPADVRYTHIKSAIAKTEVELNRRRMFS